jgi:formamidopyrimidine-DNA glycosylase
VKPFIMDAGVVAGVGNIYANEALLRAGIDPRRAAGRISAARYERLAAAIRAVLQEAIAQGGTTLRDFYHGTGEPGYFRIRLAVYGREGEPCVRCGRPIRCVRQAQRSTYYCGHCQR